MQHADDEELADALRSGQSIEVAYTLKFDWRRDGEYGTDFADLSSNFIDGTLDAQFTGNYPTEFEVNDGYAQRRFTAHVTGSINDVHVLRFFSPYSGQWGGQVGAVGTPCYYSVRIRTETGYTDIRQFTGYLLQATPKRSEGTVELELADVTSQLTNGITLAPAGRSQTWAQWAQSSEKVNDRMRQRGGTSLSWFLLHCARVSGLYQGPKPPKTAVAYWTLAGGVLPEVGDMSQMPRDGRQSWPLGKGAWIMSAYRQLVNELPQYAQSFDYDQDYPVKPWSPNINSPAVYPRYMWEWGEYGPVMLRDVYDADVSSLHSKADAMRFTGTTSDPIKTNPTYGKVVRVGLGGWIELDSGCLSDNLTQLTVMLTGFAGISEVQPEDVNRKSVYGPSSFLRLSVYPRTGELELYLYFEDESAGTGAMEWEITRDGGLSDGWHYLAFVVEFGGSGSPLVRLKTDDDVQTVKWSKGNSYSYPTGNSTYKVNPDGRTIENSGVYLTTSGGAQHWGVWYQPSSDTVADDPVDWSNGDDCIDYEPRTDIGPSMARVMWTPSVRGEPAWDVMKEVGSADLGVVYTDEHDILRYANWEDVIKRRDTGETTLTLTLDEVDEVDPFTTFDSVANLVSYDSQDGWLLDTTVFKADDPQQFMAAPGVVGRWQTTVEDAVSVLPGRVTPRRLAQGYASTTAGSGDNPSGSYTPQDFMRAYPPDKWKNGYESHSVGDIQKSGNIEHPKEGTGVSVFTSPGWAEGDMDPRHITIIMDAGDAPRGKPVMAAVDDNTAFLNVRGYKLEKQDKATTVVASTDHESFRSFGNRQIARSTSDWASDYYTQYDLTWKLADELAQPRPVFDSVDVLGDPRRQLQDVVRIEDPGGIGGPIYATVVGINRKFDTSAGIQDSLTLRTFGPRTGFWQMDDPGFSEMDTTTLIA